MDWPSTVEQRLLFIVGERLLTGPLPTESIATPQGLRVGFEGGKAVDGGECLGVSKKAVVKDDCVMQLLFEGVGV